VDNLTHSLFGLTLARTPLSRAGRGVTMTLLLASNAPDIDIVASAGGLANYLAWHRGPTHGPIGIVGLGLLSAAIVWLGERWWRRPPEAAPASLWRLSAAGCAGVLCHVLMDLPTSYGTRALSPFSWTWFAQDWMPIVDIYLLAILSVGLLLGRRRGADGTSLRQRNAYLAIALMMANYGVHAWAHHWALAQAPGAFAGRLPEPCPDAVPPGGWIEWWPRPAAGSPRDRAAERCLVEIAAIPTFSAPVTWRLVARLSNGYELRDVSIRQAPTSELVSIRYPDQWTPAVLAASTAPVVKTFLGFSRFPAARSVIDVSGETIVRFADMRFVMNRLGDQRPQTGGMFGATARVAASGAVVEDRLGF
jgi:membrane-bound metal-dependent hydrolase YbcI (DUF457 family)